MPEMAAALTRAKGQQSCLSPTSGQTPPPFSSQGKAHLPAQADAASTSRRSWGAPARPCTAAAGGNGDPAPQSAVPPGHRHRLHSEQEPLSQACEGQAMRHAGTGEACSWHGAPGHLQGRTSAAVASTTPVLPPQSGPRGSSAARLLRGGHRGRPGRGSAPPSTTSTYPPHFRKGTSSGGEETCAETRCFHRAIVEPAATEAPDAVRRHCERCLDTRHSRQPSKVRDKLTRTANPAPQAP